MLCDAGGCVTLVWWPPPAWEDVLLQPQWRGRMEQGWALWRWEEEEG